MSARTRVRIVVAIVALLAAALVVAVTIVQSRDEREPAPEPQATPLPQPLFYPDFGLPSDLVGLAPREQLEALQERAAAGDVQALLVLGVAYQRAGERDSAREAFDRALEREPGNLRARVAAAVIRFDRDEPAAAFSRLGPLARDHPRAALVRFHLGLLLLWIRELEEARVQLERALAADPSGFYGREARALLERLPQS